jgi:hypothetical protein
MSRVLIGVFKKNGNVEGEEEDNGMVIEDEQVPVVLQH